MKTATTLALVALVAAPVASAQLRPEIAVGYDANLEAVTVGAGFRTQLSNLPVTLAPHVDYYLVKDATALQGNIDGLYSFPGNSFSPYIGAGLALGYEKGDVGNPQKLDTDGKFGAGVNFLFGGTLNGVGVRPFAQLRLTAGTAAGAGIGVGLVF